MKMLSIVSLNTVNGTHVVMYSWHISLTGVLPATWWLLYLLPLILWYLCSTNLLLLPVSPPLALPLVISTIIGIMQMLISTIHLGKVSSLFLDNLIYHLGQTEVFPSLKPLLLKFMPVCKWVIYTLLCIFLNCYCWWICFYVILVKPSGIYSRLAVHHMKGAWLQASVNNIILQCITHHVGHVP